LLPGDADLRVQAIRWVRRRPREEHGAGKVGYDRRVEVKGRGAREEGAGFLDRIGIRVDLERPRRGEADEIGRGHLPESDWRAEYRRTELSALALEAAVERVEAIRCTRGAGGEARLLRKRGNRSRGREVVR